MTTYVALDIESTGLDACTDQVLEIGAIAFSSKFQIIDRIHAVIELSNFTKARLAGTQDPPIDQFVSDMHTKNGLWDECKKSHIAEAYALEALHVWLNHYPDARLFGRGVEGFDKAFIEQRRPGTITKSRLSHRCINLRSVLLLSEFGVQLPEFKNNEKHRSLDDCMQDIEMLKKIVEAP